MDEEMNFPNPVVRTDLPTRPRKLPRVIFGVFALGAFTLVFLPQILSSKVGRKFVVSYISSKTNSPVTLESFQTSWFGGTTVRFLSIADPMNRRIGCKSLTCKASLWNLLRGKYKLGETEIEGLNFDYVVDDGRGADSFDRMKAGGDAAAPSPDTRLPELSGKINVKSGTITLYRGTVQPKLFNVTWESGRLESVHATLDIESLNKPFTYDFWAETTEENVAERGEIASKGTIDLAEDGRFDSKDLKMDVTISGENVRPGSLGAALIPSAAPGDVREALGTILTKLDVAIKAADGKVVFERCEGFGPVASFHLRPTINLGATPAVLGVAEKSTISMGVSNRLAQAWLVYLNPFFREAVGGKGTVEITVENLQAPMTAQWTRSATAGGRFKAKKVVLARKDEMSANQPLPDNLASQMALLMGDTEKETTLEADGQYSVADGKVSVSPMLTALGNSGLMLEGSTTLEGGAIDLTARIGSSGSLGSLLQAPPRTGAYAIPIGGTIRQPTLGVFNVKGDIGPAVAAAVNDRINQQITRMRAKETQRLMQKSENEVREILRPLQAPPQPATTPSK